MSPQSPVQRLALWAGLSIIILATAIWATIKGVFPHLISAAPFIAMWTGTALYLAIAAGIRETRASLARTLPVPFGVLLRAPFWIRFSVPVYVLGLGAKTAALLAAFGLRTLGFGVAIVSVALVVPFLITTRRIGVTGIIFEREGLRAHLGDAAFLVPWVNIASVEAIPHRKLVRLQLKDTTSAFRSLDPDSPRTRKRLATFTLDSQNRIILAPWLGCLDSATLARAITLAITPNQNVTTPS